MWQYIGLRLSLVCMVMRLFLSAMYPAVTYDTEFIISDARKCVTVNTISYSMCRRNVCGQLGESLVVQFYGYQLQMDLE